MAAESIENKYSKYILVKGSKLSTFNLRDQRRNLKDPNVFNHFRFDNETAWLGLLVGLFLVCEPLVSSTHVVDKLCVTSLCRIGAGILASNSCSAGKHQCLVWCWLWEATNDLEFVFVHFKDLL